MRLPISDKARSRFLTMAALVFAAEMIYALPLQIPRYYRPTMLEVFGFSYADLGDVLVPYGITAMISYFPGGIIADRYSARKLMSLSLLATAGGGLYLLTLPSFTGLAILNAFWGVTTVLLFWCAMIRATRRWGGQFEQGRGFGLLDGGRGLVAALLASAGVLVLRSGLGPDPALADAATREAAFQSVIVNYIVATLAASLAVWWFIPESPGRMSGHKPRVWSGMKSVLGMRIVWMQAIVVVCAYCGYKGLDNYSVYAFDVLGMDEASAAGFAASAAYIRPVAAVLAGFMGDRFGIARMTAVFFAVIVGCWGVLAALDGGPEMLVLVYANLLISIFGVFALRGLYFALLEQTRVPHLVTGAAVGLISLVGYTPDVFFAAVTGRLLDATPGVGGYQHSFIMLAAIGCLGLIVVTVLHRGFGRPSVPRST